jgi:hypothetical protein
VHIPGAGAE